MADVCAGDKSRSLRCAPQKRGASVEMALHEWYWRVQGKAKARPKTRLCGIAISRGGVTWCRRLLRCWTLRAASGALRGACCGLLRGAVALADAGADDAAVAAVAVSIARSDDGEETVDGLGRHEVGERLTAGVDAAVLAEGDHLLDDGTRGLGLRNGGVAAVVENDGGDEVAQKSATM